MKPLGDGFIKLVKTVIAPIVPRIVAGIASMADIDRVDKTGGLAPLHFAIVGSLAPVIGPVVVNLVQSGPSARGRSPLASTASAR